VEGAAVKENEMSDRELLELAAKAAGGTNGESTGLFYQWHDLLHTGVDRVLRYVGQREWNPLTDDGDALRLAVKLGLVLYMPDKDDKTVVARTSLLATAPRFMEEARDSDPCAATRRAIVRAAAEIGKTL
jgi:hypothetical protein